MVCNNADSSWRDGEDFLHRRRRMGYRKAARVHGNCAGLEKKIAGLGIVWLWRRLQAAVHVRECLCYTREYCSWTPSNGGSRWKPDGVRHFSEFAGVIVFALHAEPQRSSYPATISHGHGQLWHQNASPMRWSPLDFRNLNSTVKSMRKKISHRIQPE